MAPSVVLVRVIRNLVACTHAVQQGMPMTNSQMPASDTQRRELKVPFPAKVRPLWVGALGIAVHFFSFVACLSIARGDTKEALLVVGCLAAAPLYWLWMAKGRFFPPLSTVERDGNIVRVDGLVLDAAGDIEVVHHVVTDTVPRWSRTYRLLAVLLPHRGAQHYVDAFSSVVGTRRYVDAISRMSGLSVRWRNDAFTEVRAASELDQAIATRAKRSRPRRVPRREHAKFAEERIDDGWALTNQWGARLRVTSTSIEFTKQVLGAVPWRTTVDGRQVKSLYFEADGALYKPVVCVGDRVHVVEFHLEQEDVERCQMLVQAALAGLPEEELFDADASAVDDDEPLSTTTSAVVCPVCPDVVLHNERGALGEQSCARCHGRLLTSAGAEQVWSDLGIERALLVDVLDELGTPSFLCPSCSTRMARAPVGGVHVDACKGCGSVWLDADELGAITRGRHEG